LQKNEEAGKAGFFVSDTKFGGKTPCCVLEGLAFDENQVVAMDNFVIAGIAQQLHDLITTLPLEPFDLSGAVIA
jgi:hypothetical protein